MQDTTSPSPFVWLKDLCTHFDWLHAGAQALVDGRPLPPSDIIPDHAIGEIIRAFHHIEGTLRTQRDEAESLRGEATVREADLRATRAEMEALRRDADDAKKGIDDARREVEQTRRLLDDRQRTWDENEAKWLHERLLMEQKISALDQRVHDIAGRLRGHAQTLQTVAGDLVQTVERAL